MKREYWKYFRVVLPYVRRYKGAAVAYCAVLVLGIGIAVLEPWPKAFLIDSALGSKAAPGPIGSLFGDSRTNLILVAVAAGILVVFITHLVGVVEAYIATRLEQKIALDFRSDLFSHCQRLSQAYLDQTRTGDFMYRINFEAHSAGHVTASVPPLIQSFLTLGAMFVVTYSLAPPLALLSLAIVPFVYYAIGFYGRVIEPRLYRVRNLESQSLTIVGDVFNLLRVVVAFNRQGYEWRRFRRQGENAVDARIRVTVGQTVFGMSVALISAIGTGLVIGFGARRVLNGDLTVGELLVILSYVAAIYDPLQTISATMARFQEELIGLKNAEQLLKAAPDVTERQDAFAIVRANGAVSFQDVSFDHPGREGTLRDITFDAAPGDVIAIVGPTGAGKTTLVNLLPRYFDPKAGTVRIDGIDVADLTLASLREQIAIVPQEPLLFTGTIEDNIRYGKLDASTEEVVEAAKAANAHDFIDRLPHKYETKLGERGARLSGGEKQRISLARALLKDAPILVLDEPTASVDSRTEATILDALAKDVGNRTTFIVAHRLGTIRNANKIVVLDHGRLVECGSHDELHRQGGLYSTLCRLQNVPGPGDRRPALQNVTSTSPGGAGAPARIVVLGMMTKMPVAGVVWQTIHYLAGFDRLGYDTYYVEAHARTPSMFMHDEDPRAGTERAGAFLADVMRRFGFQDRWALQAFHDDGRCYGMTDSRVRELLKSADLIINLHGGTLPREEHAATGRLVYVETDPVQLQVELLEGAPETREFLDAHVAFFTFGENIGLPSCRVPAPEGYRFVPTRQPVDVDFWFHERPLGSHFTTIGNWEQQGQDVTFGGETYHWSKHYEFLKVMNLPSRSSAKLELALASLSRDAEATLWEHGWSVRSALEISSDVDSYRNYILGSRGEFTVAKDQNVRLKSGWFSDRSATYLAAARPVVTQDTGFGFQIPTGEGLFAFGNVDEAAAALDVINSDPHGHARAARELAREYFNYDVVLPRLVAQAAICVAARSSSPAPGPRSAQPFASTTADFRIPADVSLEPISKRPLRLAPSTAERIAGRPVPVTERRAATRGAEVQIASLVVVAYQGYPCVRLTVESILANTGHSNYELIVVDNGSTDTTADYLAALATHNEHVVVVRNGSNRGFAGGVNAGVAVASGKLVVIMNHDVVVPPGWLSPLLFPLADPSVGMVGPVSRSAPNEARVSDPYATYGEFEVAAASRKEALLDSTFDISTLAMFCVALRRQTWERIGPLDERFGLGLFEDDDYAERLRRAGMQLLCAESVLVHHFGEASLGELFADGTYSQLFETNRRLFEEKWETEWRPHAHRVPPEYEAERAGFRALLRDRVPRGAPVVVVSNGDEELLDVEDRPAEHFMSTDGGVYAGHHPADGDEIVARLQELQALHVRYVAVPPSSWWWLERYDSLRAAVDSGLLVPVVEEPSGKVYELLAPALHSPRNARQTRTTSSPAQAPAADTHNPSDGRSST